MPSPLLVFLAFTCLLTAACQPSAGPAPVPSGNPAPAGPASTPEPTAVTTPAQVKVTLAPLVTGLIKPLYLTTARDGSGDLYVVEQPGTVRVIRQGRLDAQPFLDVSRLVRASGSEQGLLGLAFHPDYRQNGYLFVNYTDVNGNTVIARYTAAADHRSADPNSARVILTYDQPFANHNGGMLLFGPDRKLWIGTGDGGSAGDPNGNGQNRNVLLGKMLRIDVDSREPYGIPPDNPFASGSGGRPEVWGIGLRNPWRYTFDPANGDLYVADVGQNNWEEVDFVPAGTSPPVNFGWNTMEATHCYPPSRTTCTQDGLTLPITEYRTGQEGCSVTGGYVYRGKTFPQLEGRYVYGDYCKGTIWTLRRDGSRWVREEVMPAGSVSISSFGLDEAGELYAMGHNTGAVYRLIVQ